MDNRPSVSGYEITRVAFNGRDVSILYLFDNTNMIRSAVLSFALAVPVEVDDVAGGGDVGDGLALGVGVDRLLPAVAFPEPGNAFAAACGFNEWASAM